MNIITGGTGRVGSALAEILIKKGEAVTIVSRSSENAKEWMNKGAKVSVADIYDTAALHEIFKTGKSIFILNPPADPMTNTTVQEKKTVASLLEALKNSGVEKIVVESTMGAQPGENIGDLGVLYELEQGVLKLPYKFSIIRPAYYMSNWIQSIITIKEKGEMISFYPADLKFPMVAPNDIGELAAYLMIEKNTSLVSPIQGPELYSADDVVKTLSKVLKKKINLKVIPKEQWRKTYESMGFSKEAADSYANMTKVSLDAFNSPTNQMDVIKGKITLKAYIESALKI